MNIFDQRVGKTFLSDLPNLPGVYRIYSEDSQLIYVGKAKNLKRRLAQYRNAKRRRKHRKMKKIVQEMARIEIEICPSDFDATLLETRLIQECRPKWNVAGAFYFLYPMLGMRFDQDSLYFCYTSEPHLFEGYEFFGAFRSRYLTRGAYFALRKLLPFLGHKIKLSPAMKKSCPKYSYIYGFRQLPEDWTDLLRKFWRGDSKEALEQLVLLLIENAGARRKPKQVQDCLNDLLRFWRHEALPLSKARLAASYPKHLVEQKDRDIIFLKYRAELSRKVSKPLDVNVLR